MKPDIVKGYEGWYEGKYKRADNLEKRVLSVMIEQFDRPKTIIEIGSGHEPLHKMAELAWLQCHWSRPIAIHGSPGKDALAEWRPLNARSSNLPFRSNSFDLAMFVTCFEYMPDSVGVLGEAARVCKAGNRHRAHECMEPSDAATEVPDGVWEEQLLSQRAFLLDQRNEETRQESLRRQSKSGKVENYFVSRAAPLGA